MRRPQFYRRTHHEDASGTTEFVEVDATELSGLFAAPTWLRDLGLMSWLIVGVFVLVGGLVWLLSLTQTIVVPVVTAAILASVLAPLVRFLQRHRVPRGAGAALVLLLVVVLGAAFALLIMGGISSEAGQITGALQKGAGKLEGYVKDLGINSDSASSAKADASSSLSSAFHVLTNGLGKALTELASLAIFLSFTVLSLFFLLKDGPVIRSWLERHMGVPLPVAKTISTRTIGSMRGYFTGVTAVAGFNGIVIGLGALVLGVPSPARSRSSTSSPPTSRISAPGVPAPSRSSSRSATWDPAARSRWGSSSCWPTARSSSSSSRSRSARRWASTRCRCSSSRSPAVPCSARSG